MSLGGILLVICKTYETQTTLITGTATHKTHPTRARFIGREEREDNKTLRSIRIT